MSNSPQKNNGCRTLLPHPLAAAAVRLTLMAMPAMLALPALAQQRPVAVLPDVGVVASGDGGYAASQSNSSTKSDLLLRDTPQSITIITKALIQDQAMQSVADAIRYIPGIATAQGEGNRDTAVFRGNSSTSDFYVDGIRDDVQYYRDFYNIELLEALKGPNAMSFGRGGSGGVINRVTKQAEWRAFSGATLILGSHSQRRATVDIGRAINPSAALRVNAMVEDSGSFRHGVGLQRSGINPTLGYRFSPTTRAMLGYEHFSDERTADRGIPSYQGRPFQTDPATFFGDADLSQSRAMVNAFTALLEHDVGVFTLRNKTRYANYDKFYQNVFPGAVNAAGTMVAISAYNNASRRKNLFNQTDLNLVVAAGTVLHNIAAGIELGRQQTDNVRNTGYFLPAGSSTTSSVPTAAPRMSEPVVFRQSASDADNHGTARVISVYVQDHIDLSRHWQAIAGVRHDRFSVDFLNKRNNAAIERTDTPLSPRAGLVYKPLDAVSLYGSYSVAYMPRAGEQLSSLTASNQAFDPEKFVNHELGAKWDIASDLSATAAIYRLRRHNVAITDPQDATKSILVDGQQTKGIELGIAGALRGGWSVMGGYAYQDATILRTQSATARAGARLAQVPKHALSLWNRYDFMPTLGAGLGLVYRGDIFASTSNTVSLPAFTRIDGAVYSTWSSKLRLQLNIENVFNKKYYASANSNDNISPGAPRAVRISMNGNL